MKKNAEKKDPTPATTKVEPPAISAPTTACQYLEMLLSLQPRKSGDGNRLGLGLSSSGDVMLGVASPASDLSDDTNRLIRAYAACSRGLIVSARSTYEHTFFVSEDVYKREAAEKVAAEAAEAARKAGPTMFDKLFK